MAKAGNPKWQPGGKDHRPPQGPGSGQWGGEASNSPRPDFSADNQPSQDVKDVARATKIEMHARLSERRMAFADELIKIALGADNDTTRMNAINSIFDRLDGKSTQSVSGPGGEGPIAMTFRWATEEELNGG